MEAGSRRRIGAGGSSPPVGGSLGSPERQPSRELLQEIVSVARADADDVADLIGEPEALLGDRRRDRGAAGDLVDELPQRLALVETVDHLIDQAIEGIALSESEHHPVDQAPERVAGQQAVDERIERAARRRSR